MYLFFCILRPEALLLVPSTDDLFFFKLVLVFMGCKLSPIAEAETSGHFFISSFFTVLKEPLASSVCHYVY